MSQKERTLTAEVSQSSDTQERLTTSAVKVCEEHDNIHPLVEEWLQMLVKISISIAARENGSREDSECLKEN